MEAEYRKARDLFARVHTGDGERVRRAMALIAHTAYHLGAIRQLRALFDTKPVDAAVALTPFTSYERSLDGLSGTQAAVHLPDAPYSLAALLGHMVYGQDFMLAQAEGRPVPEPVHAGEGWPEVTAESFDAWRSRVLDGLARARELAHDRPASLKRRSDRPGDTQERVLNELGVHHAQHLGQIVLLRRLARLWPPPGGGDTW